MGIIKSANGQALKCTCTLTLKCGNGSTIALQFYLTKKCACTLCVDVIVLSFGSTHCTRNCCKPQEMQRLLVTEVHVYTGTSFTCSLLPLKSWGYLCGQGQNLQHFCMYNKILFHLMVSVLFSHKA